MADSIAFELAETGPVVIVNDSEKLASRAELQARAPDIAAEEMVEAFTMLEEGEYRPILDPARFEAEYRKRFATEDPDQPWQQDVARLRDFGLPDFATITAPAREGDKLIYFAADTATGLPYRVTVPLGTEADTAYDPLPLTPAPEGSAPVPDDMTQAATGPVPDEPPALDLSDVPDEDEDDDAT